MEEIWKLMNIYREADRMFDPGTVENEAMTYGWNPAGNESPNQFLENTANNMGDNFGFRPGYLDYQNLRDFTQSQGGNIDDVLSTPDLFVGAINSMEETKQARHRAQESIQQINPFVEQPQTELGTSEFAMRGGAPGMLASMPKWTGGPALGRLRGADTMEGTPFIPNPGDPGFEDAMRKYLMSLGILTEDITSQLMNDLGNLGETDY